MIFPSISKHGTFPSGFFTKYHSGFVTRFMFTTSFLRRENYENEQTLTGSWITEFP